MKLQILQENIEKAVSIASRFSSSKAQLPILGNILLSARKNKLFVSSTNLEISSSIQIGAKIEKEGEISIPSKLIFDVVSNLPKETIEMSSENEHLKISATGFSSDILGMDSTDFPKIPYYIDEKEAIEIKRDLFTESIGKILFAASVDETRPVLTGVLFIMGNNKLTLVATDGFRLSKKTIPLGNYKEKSTSIVIPKGVLGEVGRGIFDVENVSLELNEKEKQVLFGLGDTVITSRLLEGEYPDFERIIPKETSVNIFIDKEELFRAVKLASVFARDSSNVIKIKVLKESVKVSAESGQAGSQETKVDAKIEKEGKEDFEISFNYRYIEDFISSVSGDEVKMGFNDSASAGVFRDTTDSNYLHLIMPVKV